MKHTQPLNRAGFTLMEILIVMAIIVALFAILLPAILTGQKKSKIQQARIQIQNLEPILEQYATENRAYPTTEQGLFALIYLPDALINAANPATTGMIQPGYPMTGTDPNTGFAGNAMAIGGVGSADAMGGGMNPNMTGGMMDPMGGGGAMNSMGGTTPMDPMSGMMGGNPADLSMGGMGGTMGTAWNQPLHNPQLYTMMRKRSTPYLDSDKFLTDPWGNPYRYDNSMQYYGLNRTGEAKPAIWSAGPDKQDDTDDDIRNWDPIEAQNKLALRQQQMGGMGGMTGVAGGTMDPNGTGIMGTPMDQTGMMNPNLMGGGGMTPAMPSPMGGGGMTPAMPSPMGGGGMTPAMPSPMGGGGMTPVMPSPMGGGGMTSPTPMPNPTM